MEVTFTGHELNPMYDMKKLSIVTTQIIADELQKEVDQKRKVQITTSSSLIIADKINTQEPNLTNLPLLDLALLKSEDTIFPLMKENKVTNQSGIIVLNNVKIVPFANPDNVIELESYALFTDHIMGFYLTE
ncbi:hypothetical protein CYL18_18540 [Pradoshia eiseniae]|uniref:Uncharacterized protein n=1 Tax=Pradoshia eiseniae TaxID=2064768 RepID=A0A2S7MV62_9BACI|nr:hypothetical protein [Pradoshia eiseniae]PQD93691.1 hypothetical protein CYL18_18540 [Pradoshia eiseniae]